MVNETRISILAKVQETAIGESWGEFSSLYDGMIEGWLHRQGVQPQDADDIRQEVMAILLRRIGDFEHNGRTGAFRAWLKQITLNCLRDHWRKKNRQGSGGPNLDDLAAQLEDNASQQSIIWNAEHDRHVLEKLLENIAERHSERSVTAFRRIAIQQEDAEVVAQDLDMTLGAARVAQHRVLKALKEAGAGLLDY